MPSPSHGYSPSQLLNVNNPDQQSSGEPVHCNVQHWNRIWLTLPSFSQNEVYEVSFTKDSGKPDVYMVVYRNDIAATPYDEFRRVKCQTGAAPSFQFDLLTAYEYYLVIGSVDGAAWSGTLDGGIVQSSCS